MSVTTLEPVDLEAEDITLPCEAPDCDRTATYYLQFACSCDRMLCAACVAEFLGALGLLLPQTLSCETNPDWQMLVKRIKDFVLSIQLL